MFKMNHHIIEKWRKGHIVHIGQCVMIKRNETLVWHLKCFYLGTKCSLFGAFTVNRETFLQMKRYMAPLFSAAVLFYSFLSLSLNF